MLLLFPPKIEILYLRISGIVMYNNKPGYVLRANPPACLGLASDLPLISSPLIRNAGKNKIKQHFCFTTQLLDINVIIALLKQLRLPLDEFTFAGLRGDEHHSTPEKSFQISLKYQIIFSFSIALEE